MIKSRNGVGPERQWQAHVNMVKEALLAAGVNTDGAISERVVFVVDVGPAGASVRRVEGDELAALDAG